VEPVPQEILSCPEVLTDLGFLVNLEGQPLLKSLFLQAMLAVLEVLLAQEVLADLAIHVYHGVPLVLSVLLVLVILGGLVDLPHQQVQ